MTEAGSTDAGPFELGTDGPRLLVSALDDSATSHRAAAYALGLCRRQGGRLVVVHVSRTPATAALAPGAALAVDDVLAEVGQELRDEVTAAAAHLGVPLEFVGRRGDPFTEIRRLCDQVRADGVLVGASASTGHRLIGSLAVRLVRVGHWPVTVVP